MNRFDSINGCALAINQAFQTLPQQLQGEFKNKVATIVNQLPLFTLLKALPTTSLQQLYNEVMATGVDNNPPKSRQALPTTTLEQLDNETMETVVDNNPPKSCQNYNLLSISQNVWPSVGQYLTRYENSKIKLVSRQIAIDTDLKSYILIV